MHAGAEGGEAHLQEVHLVCSPLVLQLAQQGPALRLIQVG